MYILPPNLAKTKKWTNNKCDLIMINKNYIAKSIIQENVLILMPNEMFRVSDNLPSDM